VQAGRHLSRLALVQLKLIPDMLLVELAQRRQLSRGLVAPQRQTGLTRAEQVAMLLSLVVLAVQRLPGPAMAVQRVQLF
jgi:hypothetical protein